MPTPEIKQLVTAIGALRGALWDAGLSTKNFSQNVKISSERIRQSQLLASGDLARLRVAALSLRACFPIDESIQNGECGRMPNSGDHLAL